jgi:TPP-dependent pyruvate/acetoin dehydrogenase alpha subunit
MKQTGPLTLAMLDDIDAANRRRIDEAVEYARTSPLPTPGDLLAHVFVEDEGPAR